MASSTTKNNSGFGLQLPTTIHIYESFKRSIKLLSLAEITLSALALQTCLPAGSFRLAYLQQAKTKQIPLKQTLQANSIVLPALNSRPFFGTFQSLIRGLLPSIPTRETHRRATTNPTITTCLIIANPSTTATASTEPGPIAVAVNCEFF